MLLWATVRFNTLRAVTLWRILVLFGMCMSLSATDILMTLELCVILVGFNALLRAVTLCILVGSDAFKAVGDPPLGFTY